MNIINKPKRLFSMHQRPKVFCIGYNKTGTTTLERVMKDFGYRVPSQKKQERRVVEELYRGNHVPLYTLCKKYDAFQDMPFSRDVTYAIVDAMFPGSKFILTVRDPDEWFASTVRFHLQSILKLAGIEKLEDFNELTFKDKDIYIRKNYLQNVYKRFAVTVVDHEIHYDWSLVYNKAHRIEQYERRNEEIVKHFQDRQGQLLVLDLSKEKDNSKIVEFLNLPNRFIDTLPHLNKSQ